jgi:hypothetical protein
MKAIPHAFAILLVAAAGCAQTPPPPSDATVAAHVAEARRLAGDDLKPLLGLCNAAPAIRPDQASIDKLLAAVIAQPVPDPGRVFDNLYFVGSAFVSAWAIRTSEGVILIDALNNADEAKRVIDDGMRKVGLDPADIRWVVVTHAHGDHYGGLEHLVPRYRPGIVMSEADWRQAEGRPRVRLAALGPPAEVRRVARPQGQRRRQARPRRHDRDVLRDPGPHRGHPQPRLRRPRRRPAAPGAALGRHGVQLRQGRAAARELHRRDAAHGRCRGEAEGRRDALQPSLRSTTRSRRWTRCGRAPAGATLS